MKRRDFVRKSLGAGLAAGSAMAMRPYVKAFGQAAPLAAYDLVAVKGGRPGQMFDRAIQSMGGMEKYVKKGQTVVIKPNLGWDAAPERAANTNPELVGRIIEHCIAAGAKDVYVFDNTINEWTRCYKNSGIEKAARDAGAKLVIINLTSTPMDRDATLFINNKAGETMAAVIEKVKKIMKNQDTQETSG